MTPAPKKPFELSEHIADRDNLVQVSDKAALIAYIDAILKEHRDVVRTIVPQNDCVTLYDALLEVKRHLEAKP